MVAALLELHHDVQQRHLLRPFGVERLEVPGQDVLVVFPVARKNLGTLGSDLTFSVPSSKSTFSLNLLKRNV